VNARDKDGSTPLYWAVWRCNKDLVVFLLEHGADQRVRGAEGLTPLETAEKYEAKEMAALLESHAIGQGIPLEVVRSPKAEEARRAAAAKQGIPKRQAGPEEIRATSIEEWFRRLGNDTQFGYTPFSALNALIAKAKEGADSKNEVIRRATETIDDRKGNEVKRWQCCYVLSGTRDPSVISALVRALRDRSEIVRAVAACALGAFDEAEATSALETAAKTEKSRDVVTHIQKSLRGEYRKRGAGVDGA
jgi:ankyrin repeat protein